MKNGLYDCRTRQNHGCHAIKWCKDRIWKLSWRTDFWDELTDVSDLMDVLLVRILIPEDPRDKQPGFVEVKIRDVNGFMHEKHLNKDAQEKLIKGRKDCKWKTFSNVQKLFHRQGNDKNPLHYKIFWCLNGLSSGCYCVTVRLYLSHFLFWCCTQLEHIQIKCHKRISISQEATNMHRIAT